MSGLIESATSILGASERRLEIIASNVANVATPGFKRQLSFTEALAEPGGANGAAVRSRADLAPGSLSVTGNPLDLAISGSGFFRLRAGDAIVYSRQGQFRVSADGRVVDPQGAALQDAEGSDLVLDRSDVQIRADGTVLDQGLPVARIALFAPAEGAEPEGRGAYLRFAADAAEQVTGSELRQGMVEASNVTMGDEMVGMMAALRQAEGGARLVQVYDELIGRALTTFGGTGQ